MGRRIPRDGTLEDRARAVSVIGIDSALSLVAQGDRACVMLVDGTTKCWGRDDACNVKGENTLACGRSSPKPGPTPRVAPPKGALELRLGSRHACARFEGGKVACWGSADSGELGGRLPTYETTSHGGGGAMETKTLEESFSDELRNVDW